MAGKLVLCEGDKFNDLVVMYETGINKFGKVLYHCKCICGKEVDVISSRLVTGLTKSCGCRRAKTIGDKYSLVGNNFERLTVLEKLQDNRYRCKCSCGNEIITSANNLRSGDTKSCGCIRHDSILVSNSHKTHGMSGTRFYNIWSGMVERCNNVNDKAYANYGGRGIKCLWSSFSTFKEDMYESYLDHVEKYGEDQTTLDRIDNNNNYCKENCKWSTREEQNNNKRTNCYIDVDGESYTASQYSRKYDLPLSTVLYRKNRGIL
nr:MAG TPA: hypothetical protein [Caudoviricetes sp.]